MHKTYGTITLDYEKAAKLLKEFSKELIEIIGNSDNDFPVALEVVPEFLFKNKDEANSEISKRIDLFLKNIL